MTEENVELEARLRICKGWAEELLQNQASVIHLPTLAVGKAKAYFDGLETFWKDPGGNELVGVGVLELTTGHGLIADPEKFLEMTPADIAYYAALQAGIGGVITATSKAARAFGVSHKAGPAILVSVLRAQLAALRAEPAGDVG